jgi:Tfp pilus assembly protein PilO
MFIYMSSKNYITANTKQSLICLGIGLLVLILGYMTDIRFLQKRLQSFREQKFKTNQLLQSKNQEKRRLKIESQKTKAVPIQYMTKLKQWSHAFSMPDILNDLEQAVINSKVELEALEPQTTKENEFFAMYSIKLEVTGQYKNLLVFMNNVFNQPYFIAFKELTLQKKPNNDADDELNMQVLLTVTTIKSSSVNNMAITLPEKDIFTKAIGNPNLFLWANRELSFLGMIEQDKNIYGFVSDPMGTVHRITVGDTIGLKQNKIIAINEHGIATENNANNIYRRK